MNERAIATSGDMFRDDCGVYVAAILRGEFVMLHRLNAYGLGKLPNLFTYFKLCDHVSQYILEPIDIVMYEQSVCVVYPLMDYTLSQYLDCRGQRIYSDIQIAMAVATGMSELIKVDPNNGYVHTNLTSNAVFVSNEHGIRVGGLLSASRYDGTQCGTLSRWSAPQQWYGYGYDFGDDVYSYGMILLEIKMSTLSLRQLYFQGCQPWNVEQLISWVKATPQYKLIIQACISDIQDRPTFVDILEALGQF